MGNSFRKKIYSRIYCPVIDTGRAEATTGISPERYDYDKSHSCCKDSSKKDTDISAPIPLQQSQKGKDTVFSVRRQPQVNTVSAKKETLADTVEYTITGTQGTYTIQPGESLVKVSLKFYGNKKLWPYLVRHNKDIIKDADNIPKGITIRIPVLTPKSDKNKKNRLKIIFKLL